jgi:CO dehydrogenase/acetyl-CoA synthase beta subunit
LTTNETSCCSFLSSCDRSLVAETEEEEEEEEEEARVEVAMDKEEKEVEDSIDAMDKNPGGGGLA